MQDIFRAFSDYCRSISGIEPDCIQLQKSIHLLLLEPGLEVGTVQLAVKELICMEWDSSPYPLHDYGWLEDQLLSLIESGREP